MLYGIMALGHFVFLCGLVFQVHKVMLNICKSGLSKYVFGSQFSPLLSAWKPLNHECCAQIFLLARE